MLRVSLEELQNSSEKGGLGLPCLRGRNNALMLSQLLRLLKSGDRKSLGHIGYWMGELLGDLLAGIDGGEHAQVVPAYYDHLSQLVADAKASDIITQGNWKVLTSKIIYNQLLKSKPVPKVELEAGISFKNVWKRVSDQVLTATARESLYLLIHNKLPVRERLFRIGLVVDPYCGVCFGAEICDIEHFFCSCPRVSDVWEGVRTMLVEMLGLTCSNCSNLELISLKFPGSLGDKEGVWLIGTFISWVWEKIFIRGAPGLKKEEFFGFLKFKYRMAHQLGTSLGVLPELAL